MPDLVGQNPGEFAPVEQREEPVGDADCAVLGSAHGEGVRQGAGHTVERGGARQAGAAGKLGEGGDEAGRIAPRQALRPVAGQQHAPRQFGREEQARDHAECNERAGPGPRKVVTETQAIPAISDSSSTDWARLSRR